MKQAAAELEPSWANAGKKPGVEVWRIEQFKVVPVPKECYGSFYDGDSYIVLSTEAVADRLSWDVHFWLGKHTSIDEAGTAAYKAVELDDLLGGRATQHRQVQGSEEFSFLRLFDDGLTILEGGVSSGFNHVSGNPGKVIPRLFHVKGTSMRNVKAVQVEPTCASLNEGDVFVLSAGKEIYVFQGATCAPGERMKGSNLAESIASKRSAAKVKVVTTDDAPEEFWQLLGGKQSIAQDAPQAATIKKLVCLSETGGNITETLVAEGSEVKGDKLRSDDVFIVDLQHEIYIWVGKGASEIERKEAMPRAQSYLNKQSGRSPATPIVRVLEGVPHANFDAALHATA